VSLQKPPLKIGSTKKYNKESKNPLDSLGFMFPARSGYLNGILFISQKSIENSASVVLSKRIRN
jgi:hypothetical protein